MWCRSTGSPPSSSSRRATARKAGQSRERVHPPGRVPAAHHWAATRLHWRHAEARNARVDGVAGVRGRPRARQRDHLRHGQAANEVGEARAKRQRRVAEGQRAGRGGRARLRVRQGPRVEAQAGRRVRVVADG
jgi:hypothetical protein